MLQAEGPKAWVRRTHGVRRSLLLMINRMAHARARISRNIRRKKLEKRGDRRPSIKGDKVKSSQGLLFSEAKKPYAEAVGQTGAQGLVRGCGPHCPPVSRKYPARDEASGAPRAGRGSASFSGLISGVRVLSPALSGGRPGFRGKMTHLDRPAAQATEGGINRKQ